MTHELDEMRARYRRETTEELLRMINVNPRDYRPEAVRVAREELISRGVAPDGDENTQTLLAQLKEEAARREQEKQQEQDAPLGTGLKVLCFILAGLPGVIIAIYQTAKGRTRRSREAWKWVGYGFLFALALRLLFYL